MLRHSSILGFLALVLIANGCTDDGTGADAGDTMAGDGTGTDTTGSADGTDGTDTDTTTEGDLTGQELYTMLCSACHGSEGQGSTIAYEIQHPHIGFSKWVVRNGRTSIEFANQTMPQFTTDALSDAELDLILEYLNSIPQPTGGEALYLDYCRNCHGVDANGGVVGEGLHFAPLFEFIEKTREGNGGTNYGVRTLFMPGRPASELSDVEIQEIFDYVQTL